MKPKKPKEKVRRINQFVAVWHESKGWGKFAKCRCITKRFPMPDADAILKGPTEHREDIVDFCAETNRELKSKRRVLTLRLRRLKRVTPAPAFSALHRKMVADTTQELEAVQ
jgi:hypothetical protein